MDGVFFGGLAFGVVLCSCATLPGIRLRSGDDFGEQKGQVWVRGPWESIQPASDIDGVIDQLCPAVMKLDRARDGDDGLEYCGLLYTLPDGQFYATVASPLTASPGRGPTKSCRMPRSIREQRAEPLVIADYHSHPWYRTTLSYGDMKAKNLRYSIRIQFQTSCRVLKYVPHLGEPVPGEVYERVGRTWKWKSIVPIDAKDMGEPVPPLEVP
jgi:proteasome lid subunit RPN8/RPN11